MNFPSGLMAGVALLAAAGAGWKTDVNPYGLRRTEVAGEARFGQLRTPARLALQCRPGAKGSLIWELEVEHAAKLGEFRFDDFEGPDAAAAEQALSELSIEGGLMHPQVKLKQSGFYHGTRSDSFVFAVAAEASAASEAALLADAIGPGTLGITWTVTSPRDVSARLEAHFPAQDAAEAVKATMPGCGPAPPITDEMAAAWRGKDPNDAGVFEQRAIDWRLQGLLGPDYAQFRAAFAKSEPAGAKDDVFYLMGQGEDGSTAVWYGLRKGGLGEAVVIRSRKAKRYVDEDAPTIPAPDAVRAFIAKAM